MSKILDLSVNVDSRMKRFAQQIPNYAGKDSELAKLLWVLAEGIDAYRAEVAKELEGLRKHSENVGAAYEKLYDEKLAADREIEGLRGDVKSAEAAYEREGLRLNEIQRQRDQWKDDHDRVAKEKHQLAKDLKCMTLAKDEWRADSCATEAKLEKAIAERDEARRDVQRLQGEWVMPDDVVDASFDPGAPEGDKTVISWACCGVTHNFTAPKIIAPGHSYTHAAECHECGSKTTFGMV